MRIPGSYFPSDNYSIIVFIIINNTVDGTTQGETQGNSFIYFCPKMQMRTLKPQSSLSVKLQQPIIPVTILWFSQENKSGSHVENIQSRNGSNLISSTIQDQSVFTILNRETEDLQKKQKTKPYIITCDCKNANILYANRKKCCN